MIAILQNIRSMHNVGSIFRTADAVGIEKLYLCGITPAPTDRFEKVRLQFAKVALGAEKYVLWEKCVSTAHLIAQLKKSGYRILALEQSPRSIAYFSLPSHYQHTPKIALLVGNEVKGLPRALLAQCDTILEIPMHGKKESLNVAVAFGVVAFYLKHEAQ